MRLNALTASTAGEATRNRRSRFWIGRSISEGDECGTKDIKAKASGELGDDGAFVATSFELDE